MSEDSGKTLIMPYNDVQKTLDRQLSTLRQLQSSAYNLVRLYVLGIGGGFALITFLLNQSLSLPQTDSMSIAGDQYGTVQGVVLAVLTVIVVLVLLSALSWLFVETLLSGIRSGARTLSMSELRPALGTNAEEVRVLPSAGITNDKTFHDSYEKWIEYNDRQLHYMAQDVKNSYLSLVYAPILLSFLLIVPLNIIAITVNALIFLYMLLLGASMFSIVTRRRFTTEEIKSDISSLDNSTPASVTRGRLWQCTRYYVSVPVLIVGVIGLAFVLSPIAVGTF